MEAEATVTLDVNNNVTGLWPDSECKGQEECHQEEEQQEQVIFKI